MLRHPIVGDVWRAGCVCFGTVEMEGQELPYRRDGGVGWIRLLECRALIGKPAHAAVASKVVIKGPVFLNQDHHMFDVS